MNRRAFNRTLGASLGAMAVGRLPSLRTQGGPRVNGERLARHLAGLAEFGKNPQGGVSRVAYSEFDRQGREYVMGLMRAAGLDVRIDAAGNILGRRAGRDANLPPLLFGSHIDSVPLGGNYDGPVGSLGAIEVAQSLAEARTVTRHPLEVVIWQNEEGGVVGSSAMARGLRDDELALTSRSGKTIREGIAFIGGDVVKLADARRSKGDIAAYLELHIEQGAVLERGKIDIGVVEGIVGIGWWDVTITGVANHAGTTPMNERHDAMLAAARFVEMVNRVVTSTPGRQVGTVGRIQAQPGAPNVIPGTVALSLEIRDLDAAKIASLFERIQAEAAKIGESNGTTFAYRETFSAAPAPSDERVRGTIEASAKELGLSTQRMPSGAGHDAQSVARIAPMGMIFVPSVGGISHAPQELTKQQDIVNGANVLMRALLKLDAVELRAGG